MGRAHIDSKQLGVGRLVLAELSRGDGSVSAELVIDRCGFTDLKQLRILLNRHYQGVLGIRNGRIMLKTVDGITIEDLSETVSFLEKETEGSRIKLRRVRGPEATVHLAGFANKNGKER
jgi:hypothetical protein